MSPPRPSSSTSSRTSPIVARAREPGRAAPVLPGAGLAHLGSCLAVGERLREPRPRGDLRVRRHDAAGRGGGGVPGGTGPGASRRRPPQAAGSRAPRSCSAQAEADRAVLERLRPDAVVVDLRIPSTLAAARAGVPALALHALRALDRLLARAAPVAEARAAAPAGSPRARGAAGEAARAGGRAREQGDLDRGAAPLRSRPGRADRRGRGGRDEHAAARPGRAP